LEGKKELGGGMKVETVLFLWGMKLAIKVKIKRKIRGEI